jgi:hypothetical protein
MTSPVEPPEPPDSDSARDLEDGRRRASIEAAYTAARRALGLARAYRREPGSTGRRERECFEEVQRIRRAIVALRRTRPEAAFGDTPGLHKADAAGPERASVGRRAG